jgi:glycosyltransferase involved in cell wall biosynthesis
VPAFSPASLDFRLAPPGLAEVRRRHAVLLAATVIPEAVEYGADVLLDAFVQVRNRLPGAGLLIYGPGTRAPAFAHEVMRRGLKDSVHLFGPLARERALAVVAACDLFVRPTRADGDAISVREALALGRPVVASAVGTRPPEAITFTAGDAAECAEKIFHIVGNGGPRASLKSAFGPDCIPALLAIYRRCGLAVDDVTTGTPLAMSPV